MRLKTASLDEAFTCSLKMEDTIKEKAVICGIRLTESSVISERLESV
jgi:hypothetical protein